MSYSTKEIRRKTQDILKKNDLFDYPINLKSLVKKSDISLENKSFNDDDVSGFLAINKGKATIAVNKNHHINRRRFTIAHELGHFYLHAKSPKELFLDEKYHRNSISKAGVDIIEIEANRFAAELLMPLNFLKDAIKEVKERDIFFSIEDDDLMGNYMIDRLSEKFKVSSQAMQIRLSDLVLE